MSTVKSSNLPNNIKNEHHHLPIAGRELKLLNGFRLPNAGPTFPKEEAAPPMADSKSSPMNPKPKAPIIKESMYSTKKAMML